MWANWNACFHRTLQHHLTPTWQTFCRTFGNFFIWPSYILVGVTHREKSGHICIFLHAAVFPCERFPQNVNNIQMWRNSPVLESKKPASDNNFLTKTHCTLHRVEFIEDEEMLMHETLACTEETISFDRVRCSLVIGASPRTAPSRSPGPSSYCRTCNQSCNWGQGEKI